MDNCLVELKVECLKVESVIWGESIFLCKGRERDTCLKFLKAKKLKFQLIIYFVRIMKCLHLSIY